MIRTFFIRVWNWLKGSIWPGPLRWRCQFLEEVPEWPSAATVYVIGEDGHNWSAAFICPCGCSVLVQLNLLRDERPCWDVTAHSDGTVSLSPSVWRTVGCRSHFILSRGDIRWCQGEKSSWEP